MFERKDMEGKRDYLEFTAFFMSLRLSYSQIEKIGYFLKKFANMHRLEFLQKSNFPKRISQN